MRILLTIHHELECDSGAAGSVLELADAYKCAGHEVSTASFRNLPPWLPVQLKMVLFPFLVFWSALTGGYDVIDAATGDAWLVCLLKPGHRPRVVTRSHGLEHVNHDELMIDHRRGTLRVRRRFFIYHGGFMLYAVALSLRRADATCFLNDGDRDYAAEHLGVPSSRAFVVGNGLPTALLGLPIRQQSAGPPALAVIGSFSHRKGVEYLVPTLTQLLERYGCVQVSLLGTGIRAATVLEHFPREIRPRIAVLPRYRREQLPTLLEGHEICISMALAEGFGKGIIEAMACGLVPVAAMAHGPRQIIRDGHNGLLVPPRNIGAAAMAISRLLDDPEMRLRMRRAAHADAQKFTWSAAAAQRLQVLSRWSCPPRHRYMLSRGNSGEQE